MEPIMISALEDNLNLVFLSFNLQGIFLNLFGLPFEETNHDSYWSSLHFALFQVGKIIEVQNGKLGSPKTSYKATGRNI